MKLWHNPQKPYQAENVEVFELQIVQRFPWLKLYQPSPEKAPWHVQAEVSGENGYSVIVNFWPASMKAHREGHKAVEGIDAIRSLIAEIIDEAQQGDDFGDVLE